MTKAPMSSKDWPATREADNKTRILKKSKAARKRDKASSDLREFAQDARNEKAGGPTMEEARWLRTPFTDDELIVLLAVLTQTKPAKKTPDDIRERVLAEAKRKGMTVDEAKTVLRRARTVAPPIPAAAKPARTPSAPKVKAPTTSKAAPAPEPKAKGDWPGGAKGKRFDAILKAITGKGATLAAIQKASDCDNANTVRANISELRLKHRRKIKTWGDDKTGERMWRLEEGA